MTSSQQRARGGIAGSHDSFSSIPTETVSPSANDDLDEVSQSEQKEGELSTGGSSRRLPTLDKFLWNLGCFFGGFIGAVIPIEGGYAEMSESVWSRQEGGRVFRGAGAGEVRDAERETVARTWDASRS